jgi:hypothetical protein
MARIFFTVLEGDTPAQARTVFASEDRQILADVLSALADRMAVPPTPGRPELRLVGDGPQVEAGSLR